MNGWYIIILLYYIILYIIISFFALPFNICIGSYFFSIVTERWWPQCVNALCTHTMRMKVPAQEHWGALVSATHGDIGKPSNAGN